MSKRIIVPVILIACCMVGLTCWQDTAFAGSPPPCANCGNHAALVDAAGYENGACAHAPPCVDGCCIPNKQAYGFYPTQWRRWPVTQAQVAPPPGGGGVTPPKLDLPSPQDEITGPPVLTPTPAPGSQGPAPNLKSSDLKSPSDGKPSSPSALLPEPSAVLPGALPESTPFTLPGVSPTLPSETPNTTAPSVAPGPSSTTLPTETPAPSQFPTVPTTPPSEPSLEPSKTLPTPLTPPESTTPPTTTPDRSQTTPLGKPSKVATATWTPACAGPSRDNPLRETAPDNGSETNPLRGESRMVANTTRTPVRPNAESGWMPTGSTDDRVVPVAHWSEAGSASTKPTQRSNPLRAD